MTILHRVVPVTIALALASGVLAPARLTWACSPGPDYDAIATSEVIVEGQITNWAFIEDAFRIDLKTGAEPSDNPNYYGPYDAIQIDMHVARTYKGSVQTDLTLVAGNTALQHPGEGADWVGPAGGCGAFDADPTGRWFILGLSRDNWGRYRPSLLQVFYAGDSAAGDSYSRAVQGLEAKLGPASLKSSGGAPRTESEDKDVPWQILLPGAFIIPIAVLLGFSFFVRRRGGH